MPGWARGEPPGMQAVGVEPVEALAPAIRQRARNPRLAAPPHVETSTARRSTCSRIVCTWKCFSNYRQQFRPRPSFTIDYQLLSALSGREFTAEASALQHGRGRGLPEEGSRTWRASVDLTRASRRSTPGRSDKRSVRLRRVRDPSTDDEGGDLLLRGTREPTFVWSASERRTLYAQPEAGRDNERMLV